MPTVLLKMNPDRSLGLAEVDSKMTEPCSSSITHPLPPLSMEMNIAGATYKVNGFFKFSGKTITDKIFGLMEKELENKAVLCNNGVIPQYSAAVGNLRRM